MEICLVIVGEVALEMETHLNKLQSRLISHSFGKSAENEMNGMTAKELEKEKMTVVRMCLDLKAKRQVSRETEEWVLFFAQFLQDDIDDDVFIMHMKSSLFVRKW